MVIHILFAAKTVAADRKAMIAGEYDQGIVTTAGLIHCVKNSSEFCIELRNDGVIGGQFVACLRRRPGATKQPFSRVIANSERTPIVWYSGITPSIGEEREDKRHRWKVDLEYPVLEKGAIALYAGYGDYERQGQDQPAPDGAKAGY